MLLDSLLLQVLLLLQFLLHLQHPEPLLLLQQLLLQ